MNGGTALPPDPDKTDDFARTSMQRVLSVVRQLDWRALGAWIVDAGLPALALLLVLTTAAIIFPLTQVEPSSVLPHGQLTLQFIGTRSNAFAVVAMLGMAAKDQIVFATQVDFVFIAAYVWLLREIMAALNRRWTGPGEEHNLLQRFATITPWLAGSFDVMENIGILLIVDPIGQNRIGLLAAGVTLSAWLKWTFVLYAAGYLVFAFIGWQRRFWFGHALAQASSIDVDTAARSSDGARDELRELGARYDKLEGRNELAHVWRSDMRQLVERMWAPALQGQAWLPEFRQSGRAGDRLVAVVQMQAGTAPVDWHWLVERLAADEPFIAYQATLALLAHVNQLSAMTRDAISVQLLASRLRLDEPDPLQAYRTMLASELLVHVRP